MKLLPVKKEKKKKTRGPLLLFPTNFFFNSSNKYGWKIAKNIISSPMKLIWNQTRVFFRERDSAETAFCIEEETNGNGIIRVYMN